MANTDKTAKEKHLTLTSGLGLDDMSDLARRGSTIGFHLLWHTLESAMSNRLCLSY